MRWRRTDGIAEMVFADTRLRHGGEVLENIFEPLFTAGGASEGKPALGLWITHRIVSQHQRRGSTRQSRRRPGRPSSVRLPTRASVDDLERLSRVPRAGAGG